MKIDCFKYHNLLLRQENCRFVELWLYVALCLLRCAGCPQYHAIGGCNSAYRRFFFLSFTTHFLDWPECNFFVGETPASCNGLIGGVEHNKIYEFVKVLNALRRKNTKAILLKTSYLKRSYLRLHILSNLT